LSSVPRGRKPKKKLKKEVDEKYQLIEQLREKTAEINPELVEKAENIAEEKLEKHNK
jgi:hypothetical protein